MTNHNKKRKKSSQPNLWNFVFRLHRDEVGLFSVSHLFTTLFLATLVVLLFNVGSTLIHSKSQRLESDAVARSIGTVRARYMNMLTAQQHLVGQLTAMITVHHALGGDYLDAHQPAATEAYDDPLRAAHRLARDCRTGTPAFQDIGGKVYAGKALLEAHIILKEELTKVYTTKAIALALQMYPPSSPMGTQLENAAHARELALYSEWKVLEQLRLQAVSLVGLKQRLRYEVLPLAMEKLHETVSEYPQMVDAMVNHFEAKLGIKIHVLPSDRTLPVQEDPLARQMQISETWERPQDCDCPTARAENPRHQIAKTTQFARAAFPWTNYHRRPILDATSPRTPITEFADLYFDHTNGVSKEFADLWQREGDFALYCLKGYEGPDKGFEAWHQPEGASLADQHLGMTILVGSKRPRLVGASLFQNKGSDYSYRYASILLVNRGANQIPSHRIDWTCKRIVPSHQAMIGMDTLNWSQEQPLSELIGIGIPPTFPKIELGWCSRLSATSAARVDQLKSQPLPDWARELAAQVPEQMSAFSGD